MTGAKFRDINLELKIVITLLVSSHEIEDMQYAQYQQMLFKRAIDKLRKLQKKVEIEVDQL